MDSFDGRWYEPVLALPLTVLKNYKRLGLTDVGMMLMLQLWGMRLEGYVLPSVKKLSERMSMDERSVADLLQFLLDHRFIRITKNVNDYGRPSEAYDLTPFFEKLQSLTATTPPPASPRPDVSKTIPSNAPDSPGSEHTLQGLMQLLEKKLARPLSPIDSEIVLNWLDKDEYSLPLIEAALEEALLLGKNSIRYMDRLLFEWTKRGFTSPDALHEPSSVLNSVQSKDPHNKVQESEHFPQVNWLEDD
ncbi:MAG: Chromosome replication initiation protein DnaD [Candidatus Carbobacillus altaicus]|uniref:Chromosome replication initiation protein DnaD n=1 Tax=Candidatus Carbonibacillus altaicus TaxID=2163959 RepID=A0A2R6Y2R3_9BACL|nr:MAG: Chromosome replication initiation protein DnaD [Candidatus Carbobacillus altaicus]